MAKDPQKSESGESGIVIGGVHLPDITHIFRHHPTRPSPLKPPADQHPVPPKTVFDYTKYLAAGGLCATITHVCLCSSKYPDCRE
jgi:hypothetical protein